MTILAVSFLVTPVLVAGLGIRRYGLWALAGVLVNYLGLLDLGVGNAFVRFLAASRGEGDTGRFNGLVRTGILLYLAFGAVTLPAVLLLRKPAASVLAAEASLAGEVEILLVGVACILVIRSLFVIFRAALAAVERMDVNNRIAMYLALPNGVGAMLVVSLGWGLPGLVANGLLTAVLTACAQTVWAYRLVPRLSVFPLRPDRRSLRDLLGYGLRIQATRLAELLNGQVDKVILALMIGAASVGRYELGLRLSLLAAALPGLILPVILPSGALLQASGDRHRLRTLHERASKYVALLLAPAILFLWLEAPNVLRLWIGAGDLEGSAFAARLLLLGAAPLLFLGVSRLTARAVGMPGMEMRASAVMAAANLILSIVLVHLLGSRGAPIGSAVAGISGGACFLFAFRRAAGDYGFRPLAPLIRPAAAAIAAAAAAIACRYAASTLSLPEGRLGALAMLCAAGVPFVAVYALAVLRGGLIDEFDQRVVRETWSLAR
jgi:O-antigen/teichoic acid export membrane protein